MNEFEHTSRAMSTTEWDTVEKVFLWNALVDLHSRPTDATVREITHRLSVKRLSAEPRTHGARLPQAAELLSSYAGDARIHYGDETSRSDRYRPHRAPIIVHTGFLDVRSPSVVVAVVSLRFSPAAAEPVQNLRSKNLTKLR